MGERVVEHGVVVTRDEGPDGTLTRLLRERGFDVRHWPTIRVRPPEDPVPLERALAEVGSFDWLVFTSRRGVAAVVERLESPLTEGRRPRVAAVGEATAGTLADHGWPVDVVPGTQTGEALVRAVIDAGVSRGTRVLFPASSIARETVPVGLEGVGAVVVQVEAYRTEPAPLDRDACRAALESGSVELVTFTSPSTVDNLVRALGPELVELATGGARAVAIGPTTGEAAVRAGFSVLVADPHSLEAMAEAAATAAARDRIEEG